MGNQKGAAINETVQAMKFNEHLRKLAEDRDRQVKRRKKKEACTDGCVQTSNVNQQINLLNNDNTMKKVCQAGGVLDEQG